MKASTVCYFVTFCFVIAMEQKPTTAAIVQQEQLTAISQQQQPGVTARQQKPAAIER